MSSEETKQGLLKMFQFLFNLIGQGCLQYSKLIETRNQNGERGEDGLSTFKVNEKTFDYNSFKKDINKFSKFSQSADSKYVKKMARTYFIKKMREQDRYLYHKPELEEGEKSEYSASSIKKKGRKNGARAPYGRRNSKKKKVPRSPSQKEMNTKTSEEEAAAAAEAAEAAQAAQAAQAAEMEAEVAVTSKNKQAEVNPQQNEGNYAELELECFLAWNEHPQ